MFWFDHPVRCGMPTQARNTKILLRAYAYGEAAYGMSGLYSSASVSTYPFTLNNGSDEPFQLGGCDGIILVAVTLDPRIPLRWLLRNPALI